MISVRTRQLVFLFTLALCWVSNVCVAATPDDGDHLYVYTKSVETPAVYAIDDVEDITFNAEGLVVTTVSGTSTPYTFSRFRLITFDEAFKPIDNPSIADGTYYLQNIETGLWLQNNEKNTSYWTTRGEMGFRGLDFDLVSVGSQFQIDPKFGGNHSLNNTNYYLDTRDALSYWTFKPQSDGSYKISSGNTQLSVDANGYLSADDTQRTTWRLVTKEERMSAMSEASRENPQDVSWLIGNPDFAYNNDRQSQWSLNWTIAGNSGAAGLEKNWDVDYMIMYNKSMEAWSTSEVDFSQTLTGLPNGKYRLSVQGFYRDGPESVIGEKYTSNAENLRARYFANNVEKKLMSICAGGQKTQKLNSFAIAQGGVYIPGNSDNMGNALGRASKCFFDGYYQNEPIEVDVTDGTLTIGIRKSSGVEDDWTVWDNFKLYYLGTETTGIDSALQMNDDEGIMNNSFNSLGQGPHAVYDLQGRKIADNPSSLLSRPSFKPGIYIVNGKKIVIGK